MSSSAASASALRLRLPPARRPSRAAATTQSLAVHITQMADPDESGKVTYEAFARLAYDVLLHVARERAISAAIENEAAEKVQKIVKGRNVRNNKK